MFDWFVVKRGVPECEQFCIGNLQMYTVLILTLRYYKSGNIIIEVKIKLYGGSLVEQCICENIPVQLLQTRALIGQ